MATYRLNLNSLTSEVLKDHTYRSGENDESLLQEIIASNPTVITDLNELDLKNTRVLLSCREYPTPRGNIDILIVTENADIVIVETKLIKNPESTRTVVAQAIDYVKGFSEETADLFWDKLSRKELPSNPSLEDIRDDERFMTLLMNNITTGNFHVVILGDMIHPNVLGMVESIQSAPHLSFTIYLSEINAVKLDEDNILISPTIVSNTFQIERSVIKIEVSSDGSTKIGSESPSRTSQGRKPVLSWQRFLDNVSKEEFKPVIQDFKDTWVSEIDDSINMGTVGFSAGVNYGDKRIPIQQVFDKYIPVISEKDQEGYAIPEKHYQEYKEALKKAPMVYDKYVVGNKVQVDFDAIDAKTLKILLDAALNLGRNMKSM